MGCTERHGEMLLSRTQCSSFAPPVPSIPCLLHFILLPPSPKVLPPRMPACITRTHYRMIGSNLQSFIPPLAGAKPQILVRWAEDFGHSFLEYVLKPRSTPQCLAKIAVGRIWSEWWAGCLWTTFIPSWVFHGPEPPAETKQPVGKHEPHGLPELSMLILL